MKIKDKEVDFSYGRLNQIHQRNTRDSYDADYMSGADAVRKTIVNYFSTTPISPGPYQGVVLYKPPEKKKGFFEKLFGLDDIILAQYTIRVPEKDSHLPEPSKLEVKDQKDPDYKKIHSHSVFRAASFKVSEEQPAEPGDLVWVDYQNDQCIYLGKVKNEASNDKGKNDGNFGKNAGPLGPGRGGGPFTAPQFAGFLKNKTGSKGVFTGNLFSKYYHKIRLKKNLQPPSAASDPKLSLNKMNHYDLSPRKAMYSAALNKNKEKGGAGFYVRDDLNWVLENTKAIINKLGGSFYAGSFYTGIAGGKLKGLSEHHLGAAVDMHLGTTIQAFPNKEEHNLEIMTNAHDWVLWLKMPKAATTTHSGRTWKSEQVSINAIRIAYAGNRRVYNWKTITGYYFNVTEAFNHHSMIGLGPIAKNWMRNPTPMAYGEMWHYDHRETHGYVFQKTTVGDVIDSQNFPFYNTPARKRRIPKYANDAARNQVFQTGYFGGYNKGKRHKQL